MGADVVAFSFLAVLVLGGALGVVITRNVAHAALYLLLSLASVAGVFILLVAEFLALVQVLIYGGAITIVLLFALMLTRAEEFSSVRDNPQWAVAGIAAISIFGVLGGVIFNNKLDTQKPIAQKVPLGQIVLGSEIAIVESLEVGDRVTLKGEKFTVSQVHDPRGNKDDVTIWIHLETAQQMLKKEGLINAIWAIECRCAMADLPKVTQEIAAYLPDTQVIEKFTKAQARANMRMEAAKLAKKTLKQEKIHRQHLENERRTLASSVISASVVAGGIWITFLSLINVRDRRSEIGILRAIGIGSSQIIKLFLFKSIIVGFLGAMLGYLIGLLIVIELNAYAVKPSSLLPMQIFSWRLMLLIVVCVPVMAAVAGWLPAFMAAGKDPAVALRED